MKWRTRFQLVLARMTGANPGIIDLLLDYAQVGRAGGAA
jgi:hypothetical protein